MPLTYEKASDELDSLVEDVAERWHRELVACELRIDTLLARGGAGLKHNGYPCAGTIKIVPLERRALGQGDALLTLNGATWDELSYEERLACVDHELEHLLVRAQKGTSPSGFIEIDEETGAMVGQPAGDDLGRPKLAMRLHDWQLGGFTKIARRHCLASLEVQAVRACRDDRGQLFWDWAEPATPVAVRPVRKKKRRASSGR